MATDSEISNLEWRVVEAAVRRRKADEALRASVSQGMPIPICHEYDAATEEYESVVSALIAARETTQIDIRGDKSSAEDFQRARNLLTKH